MNVKGELHIQFLRAISLFNIHSRLLSLFVTNHLNHHIVLHSRALLWTKTGGNGPISP